MARILAAIAALFLLLSAAARAEDDLTWGLTEVDRAAIHDVIEAQLAAFQHDDGPLAFSYASPAVQEQLGTPEDFLDMVKTAFPSVYRPREVQFRKLEATGRGPVQAVFFIGPADEPMLGLFIMQKQSDESWKINGCILTRAPDITI